MQFTTVKFREAATAAAAAAAKNIKNNNKLIRTEKELVTFICGCEHECE